MVLKLKKTDKQRRQLKTITSGSLNPRLWTLITSQTCALTLGKTSLIIARQHEIWNTQNNFCHSICTVILCHMQDGIKSLIQIGCKLTHQVIWVWEQEKNSSKRIPCSWYFFSQIYHDSTELKKQNCAVAMETIISPAWWQCFQLEHGSVPNLAMPTSCWILLHILDSTFIKVGRRRRAESSWTKTLAGKSGGEDKALNRTECDSGNGAFITINKQLSLCLESSG